MPSSHPHVAEHFDDADQQKLAASLGVWTFLATEVLFFGGLLTAYTVYRAAHPAVFAEASTHLYLWIGAGNTVVLLLSSFAMALAVHRHQQHRRSATVAWLLITLALGAVFLAVKAIEYALDAGDALVPVLNFDATQWAEPNIAEMFFVLYFFTTGLHAVHVAAGLVALGLAAWTVHRGAMPRRPNFIEGVGLYWHFVDIVWLFLFPLLYLVGTR